MFKKLYLIVLFSLLIFTSYSQENWMMKGYVKGMTSMQSADDNETSIENTLHNRFDVNWYMSDNFTFTMGVRNRIIVGNNVALIPNYSDYLSRDNGFMDLSLVWADNSSWVGISQLDRFNIDYTIGNLQITVGRQRINWGQTFVWNPNDLFNSYSYFDFDYDERPGSDAVRIQYYIGESSKIELATSLNSDAEITSMALYRFNTKGYDFQFLGGVYNQSDYVIGSGWSGSIGGGGFSGELTYYHPMKNASEEDAALTFSLHYDYTFKNSLNLQFETLYNGFAANEFDSGLGDIIFMELSPKKLFLTKFALFASGGYDITPLMRVMLSGMYGPEGNFIYLGPTLTYSMSNTMELAAIGQYYAMDAISPTIAASGNALFVRLKWGF